MPQGAEEESPTTPLLVSGESDLAFQQIASNLMDVPTADAIVAAIAWAETNLFEELPAHDSLAKGVRPI